MLPPVVDATWVHEHQPVLADVRFYLDGRSPREAYDAGHLPGAVFVDLATVLAAPASRERGRHPLPSAEVFADGLAAAGIGDGDVVVGYDDAGGMMAARLVWLLRSLGHPAALLDGGLQGWAGQLSQQPTRRESAHFTPKPFPSDLFVDLSRTSASPDDLVIDARPGDRYAGQNETIDARAGHIPGARSLPCRDNLDAELRFLPAETLRARFEAAGVRSGAEVISSCGSGVTACHNLLALEYAGFEPGRLYPGSWSQYAATDLPIDT